MGAQLILGAQQILMVLGAQGARGAQTMNCTIAEANYTTVQYMLLRLCLKDFYENSHDCGDSMIAIS